MCKLLHNPKDQVVTEDKNNIVYEVHCSNCKVVYFGEFNHIQMNTKDLPGIAIVTRKKLQKTVGKQITTLAGVRRKLLIEKVG